MTALFNDMEGFDMSLYGALCNKMKEGAAILDATTKRIIYCNHTFLKLFAIGSVEGMHIREFRKFRVGEMTAEAVKERKRIIAEKGIFNELVEYAPVTGESFFGDVSIHDFINKGRHYYFFTVNPVDKAFFDLATLGILMVNKNGVIVTVNPYILRQFGYRRSEIIGKPIELLIPSRFHHIHPGLRDTFVYHPGDGRVAAGKDLFAVKKDGTEFPVEINLGHYPTDGDRYVIAFINDISIRKNAEAESRKLREELESKVEYRTMALNETMRQLEQSRNTLQKSNQFQQALLDSAGAIIIAVDENGIIQTFNPEAERELGYKAEELIGKQTPLIFHDPLLLQKKAAELSADLHKEITAGIDIFLERPRLGLKNEEEWIYVRKDGTKFYARLNITPVKNEQGVVSGFVGIAFDISNTKRIEEELNLALKKEKELSELKSRFVTMASHEFRTPLSTVLSSAYLIEKYAAAEDQPKRELHLQRIVSSVNMLTDILNDFLSVGKIEEGKIQVRYTGFSLRELVTETIGTIEVTLKAGQQICYEHEGNDTVLLDASLLKHIIMNLASNASKFSGDGSLIEIKTRCCDERVTVSVKDHGIGISKADQQHLMERFFRGVNAGNIQGTGLGLHIVAKYAELMNGTITCNSELEKGTEFIVTFNNKTV